MSKSIIQSDKAYCFLCERNGAGDRLEEHHIFGGADRKLSEKYGLKVYICGESCHRNGPFSAHRNAEVSNALKKEAQIKAMKYYGWTIEEFRRIFGKNYLA